MSGRGQGGAERCRGCGVRFKHDLQGPHFHTEECIARGERGQLLGLESAARTGNLAMIKVALMSLDECRHLADEQRRAWTEDPPQSKTSILEHIARCTVGADCRSCEALRQEMLPADDRDCPAPGCRHVHGFVEHLADCPYRPEAQATCNECDAAPTWRDENFAPPRLYCDEHVVQDANVRALPGLADRVLTLSSGMVRE